MEKIKALVPMKGHSERVPSKNIRLIEGRPLFHWILESLSKSQYIDEIIINTDSDEIADNACTNFDVTILKRPEKLCGDMVSMSPLIKYDISQTSGNLFLQTHSTNPLVKTETIDKAIETFYKLSDHDSLFTVTPMWTRIFWKDGRPINHDPDNLIRTQDLDPIYEENSCLYIISRDIFNQRENRLGFKPKMMAMDPIESIDIDEDHDFELAEYFLKLQRKYKKEMQ